MSQQLAIAVMVDIEAALDADKLDGNIYLFDNMKSQGSQGLGTGDLVTAINSAHWFDGSQADLQILNWMLLGLGPIQPGVPKVQPANKPKAGDTQALKAGTGPAAKTDGPPGSGEKIHEVGYFLPVITDITGEAVDKKIIYPAQYGSPDLLTEGWYWSASVDTTRPGIYSYTLHILLYRPSRAEGKSTWEPVYMTHQSRLKIISEPKINAFTEQGIGFLPIA